MANQEHPAHVKRELLFDRSIRKGDRGMRARRVQEWLSFHGFATAIDDDFGDATERSVRSFQEEMLLPDTGIVEEATWQALVSPLVKVLAPIELSPNDTLSDVVLRCAEQHLSQHPIELGGDNLGVWVRVYTGGSDGRSWKWCAGFVSFVLKQACANFGCSIPIPGSTSCDSLAYQARETGVFVKGTDIEKGRVQWSDLGASQIFLVRNTPTDWTHTGFSFEGKGKTFCTIEGNTNDEGSSNGYEVCRRVRSLSSKDFIRLK